MDPKLEKYYDFIVDDVLKTATRDDYGSDNNPKKRYLIISEVGVVFTMFELGISYESAKRRNSIDVVGFTSHLRNKFGMRKEEVPTFWEHFGRMVLIDWDDLPLS